jgi:hypothetical protein
MKTIIHVNQAVIKANRKYGKDAPAIILRTYKGTVVVHEAEIVGMTRIIQRQDDPLSCGARVWIETEDEVRIVRE